LTFVLFLPDTSISASVTQIREEGYCEINGRNGRGMISDLSPTYTMEALKKNMAVLPSPEYEAALCYLVICRGKLYLSLIN
jgi:hypothetical protein